jgi:predicted RNase H-like nuclease
MQLQVEMQRSVSQRRPDDGAGPSRGVFVGVDLAWDTERRHSGIAVMEGGRSRVRLTRLAPPIHSLDGVIQIIRERLAACMLVAVDASLIVPNETGQRPCERAVGQVFGRHGASCHSSNRGRPHFDSGERLVRALRPHGFAQGCPLPQGGCGRWVIEVYPHPAMVRLFGLARILSYKKGTVIQRRAGLQLLQGHLGRLVGSHSGLAASACLTRLLRENPGARSGQALKQLEDQLDAVLCAYIAWHVWRWGDERNDLYGDLATGYVVVPRPGFPAVPGRPVERPARRDA